MTQQETLKEFMNRRMAELGLGYKALTNAGIGGQTMHNINHCIPFRMTEGTKSKLATVQSLMNIPQARYGELVIDLRALGAKL